MELKKRRWPAAIGGIVLGLSLAGGSAVAAGVGSGPFDYLDLRSPNGTIQRVTVGDDGKLVVSPQATTPPTTTPPTTTPPVTETPTTNPVGLKVVAGTTAGSAVVSWNSAVTNASYGRDGKDASGYGAWTSANGVSSPQNLTALVAGTTYNVTVKGTLNGQAVTQTVAYKVPATSTGTPTTAPPTTTPPTTTPPTTTPPTSQPPVADGEWHATGMGFAVSDAANGQANNWTGYRHSMYSTWAADGKVFAIDSPTAEYGSNSVARLGDYDLDIATQNTISSWAAEASGANNAKIRTMFQTIKDKWGTRKGHVYIRPYHEFNGDWYNWSIRNTADQANFVKNWQNNVSPIFNSVFGSDQRFKLTWSPNRDSKYGLDQRKSWPGSQYADAVALDYYDFANVTSDATWANEINLRQNGGSPVGIGAWTADAKSWGVPLYMPEWGQQFRDNPVFVGKVLGFISENRYSGTGSPAGKVLNAVWHNLNNNGGPDVNGDGDFFIQVGGKDYQYRPNAARTVREWYVANRNWLRAAPVS